MFPCCELLSAPLQPVLLSQHVIEGRHCTQGWQEGCGGIWRDMGWQPAH